MSALAEPLAELLNRMNGEDSPALVAAVRKLCLALAEGHVCLPLHQLGPAAVAALESCRVVGRPGEVRPLIIEHGHLYLARYQQYEARLAAQLHARASHADPAPDKVLSLRLRKMTSDADQQRAVISALRRRLTIITGGPGTGKTRTATIALTLLAEHLRAANPRIALAAPTGKAAARLSTSLIETMGQFDVHAAVRASLQTRACTLHRLLGATPGESQFRHHAGRPLPVDVLVVDEASMIDLPLMTKLLNALRPDARLILLGDRDQLASVEAGHVLGDICAAASGDLLECVTELTTNHRFDAESGIHQLAQFIRSGDEEGTIELLNSRVADLTARRLPHRVAEALATPLTAGWRAVAEAPSPEAALERMGDFRILCAVRDGPHGVKQVNRAAEQVLAAAGLIAPTGAFYPGRPILILRNDYQLRLFNGDLGIVRRDPSGELRAFFLGENGETRSVATARLPEHETAYAMTVHKAQGSEFHTVLLILPEMDSPILTRELLYTGITRARRQAQIWWTEPTLAAALRRQVVRWSGLRARMQPR